MRTITIGDRKISSLTRDEFGNFLYDSGYTASSEYFEKPVFIEFKYIGERGLSALFFKYTQKRKHDALIITREGHLSEFRDYFSIYQGIEFDKQITNPLTIDAIIYLLNLGIDLPLYNK